jgi:molecular chaperone GrpE
MSSEQGRTNPDMPGREAEDMSGNDSAQPSPDPDRNLTPSGSGEGPAAPSKVDPDSPDAETSSDNSEEPDPLAAAEQQRDEYLELAKRTQAEFENYRKRMGGEVLAASGRGKSEVIASVIPALDDLERAIQAAGLDPEGDSEDGLAHGVLLVFRSLREALARNGVEQVDPTGEKFDPREHEALSAQAVDGVESGVVVETMQKGYRLGEQLVRPARVVVAE